MFSFAKVERTFLLSKIRKEEKQSFTPVKTYITLNERNKVRRGEKDRAKEEW